MMKLEKDRLVSKLENLQLSHNQLIEDVARKTSKSHITDGKRSPDVQSHQTHTPVQAIG